MLTIIVGFICLGGGLLTLADTSIPIIWTGGILVGILFIIEGLVSLSKEKQIQKEINQITERTEDLLHRIDEGQSLEEIAEEYKISHNIPPIRTLSMAGHMLKELAHSENAEERAVVQQTLHGQLLDSGEPPESQISSFNFDNQVYFLEEPVKFFMPGTVKDKGVEGTLILSRGYLYFFAVQRSALQYVGHAGEAIFDKIGDKIPVLHFATCGYHLIKGLHQISSDFFTPSKIAELQERFSFEGSVAIPLVDIVSVGPVTDARWQVTTRGFNPQDLSQETVEAPTWEYAFEGESGEESATVSAWIERIMVAAIAEGQLLVHPQEPVIGESSPLIAA